MSIEIKPITQANEAALRLPNEPFPRFGHFLVTRDENGWHGHEQLDAATTTQTFPEENYQWADINAKGFAIGAFDQGKCVALATYEYEYRWNHYVYLADLKVNQAYRRQHLASKMLDAAKPFAVKHGSKGLCTIAQGSNLAANRFYLAYGFHIGGLNTNDYYHTSARGETDIYYYLDF